MAIDDKRVLWEAYQQDDWTSIWEKSIYSIEDRIDGVIGVKHSPTLPYILKYTPKNAKILEAGCGMGPWVIFLTGLGFDITGLDYSEPTIKNLQNSYPNLKFVVGDVADFDFEKESFDAMLSWGVIEHFKEGPGEALDEAYRVLSKGGILYITVPCKNYLNMCFSPILHIKDMLVKNKFIRKLRKRKDFEKKFFQYEFRRNQFMRYISEAGFEIKVVKPFNQRYGFAIEISALLRIRQAQKIRIFQKNKAGGKWHGLTKAGERVSGLLTKISPWITPNQIFIMAVKK